MPSNPHYLARQPLNQDRAGDTQVEPGKPGHIIQTVAVRYHMLCHHHPRRKKPGRLTIGG